MSKEQRVVLPPKSFPVNYLEKKLKIEQADLDFWKNIIAEGSDELAVRMAHGNINSTQSRINELQKAIDILYPYKKEKEDEQTEI